MGSFGISSIFLVDVGETDQSSELQIVLNDIPHDLVAPIGRMCRLSVGLISVPFNGKRSWMARPGKLSLKNRYPFDRIGADSELMLSSP